MSDRLAAFQAFAQGKGDGNADNEKETGKHDIDKRVTVFIGLKVFSPAWNVFDAGQIVDENHRQNDKPAVGIERGKVV
jgi:hypothetical protein